MADYDNIIKISDIMKNIDDGFLTDVGVKLLENNIFSDLELLRESVSQKPLCRLCCYMAVAYNLLLLFGGYVVHHKNTLPDDTINLEKEGMRIAILFEEELPKFQAHLNDKYAQIFHDVLRQSFKKPLFGSSSRIPVHPNDMPEGVDLNRNYC